MKYFFSIVLCFSVYMVCQYLEAAYVGVARGPAGQIFMFAGTSCPSHSIAADGTSYARSGQYANLFSAMSTAYGASTGSVFNVPDLRGKFTRGVDGSAGNDPDSSGRTACNTGGNTGNNIGSCQIFAMQQHVHAINSQTPSAPTTGSDNVAVQAGGSNFNTGNAQGANTSTETRPVNVYVKYCVWF